MATVRHDHGILGVGMTGLVAATFTALLGLKNLATQDADEPDAVQEIKNDIVCARDD